MWALLDQSALVLEWVARQLGTYDPAAGWGNSTAIGWCLGDKLIAGTVFHNWDPKAGVIEMTTAAVSPRWLTRETLDVMFERYVFGLMNCQMCVMRVSVRNERMRRIAERFGFQPVLIRRLYASDEDGIVYTLTREEWLSHSMRKAHG